jgi:hypothetical protein
VPATLTASQHQIWQETVGAMPRGWFKAEHGPLLLRYVTHAARAAEIEAVIGEIDPRLDAGTYCKLSRLGLAESSVVLSLARALRLSHKHRLGRNRRRGCESKG